MVRLHRPIATALLAAALLAGALPGAAPAAAAQDAPAAAPPDLTPLPGAADRGAAALPTAALATGDFVRMVVVLAAVLGAIYLLFLLLKRGARVRGGNGAGIAVLGSRSLGGSRSLHLVQVGRGVYLVGATDQALNLIAEVTDQDSIDALPPAPAAGNGAGRNFSDLVAELGAAVGGRRAAPAPGSFLRRQQERLQRLRRSPQVEDDGAAG